MGKITWRHGFGFALIIGLSLLFGARPSVAQPTRPRVCLVLSGGGARGIAHVGVIKALEQLHVPIDCIAGTSMGAVIGGLYASGMTAAQIDETIRSVDWQEAFRDAARPDVPAQARRP